jgi:predicted Zn-dependent protease
MIMKKIILPALFFIALFFGAWYALSKVDWIRIFRIEKIAASTEQKLGDYYWDYFSKIQHENKSTKIYAPVDSIVTRLCEANNIDRKTIKLHIVETEEINAFALPNGHLVVFTGLIKGCESDAELAGVLGHEMAHIQKGHVMKKLIKEVGLSALMSIASGKGGKAASETAKLLSSAAYDRKLEKEADLTSVEYMENAHINPEPFADFLFRLSKETKPGDNYLAWISTHPDSEERSKYILAAITNKSEKYTDIVSAATWQQLQDAVKELQ